VCYLDKAIILHWVKKKYFVGSVFHSTNRLWVRWETKHLLIGKLSQEYSSQKL